MPDQPPVHDLAELERLLKEATPGPWYSMNEEPPRLCADTDHVAAEFVGVRATVPFDEADARFIAAAVNALPDLLAVVKAAWDLKLRSEEAELNYAVPEPAATDFREAVADAWERLGFALRPFYGSDR